MNQHRTLTKRDILKSAGALVMTTHLTLCPSSAQARQAAGNTKTLVACFTRTGNTAVIARLLRRALGADLFEIQPATSYPEDYEETVRQAEQERIAGYEPLLKETVANLNPYDTVFLGFPIWGTTAPAVMRSFLKVHDLRGKTVHPFITHGGYGLGNSMSVLASHASSSRIEQPFVMEADQERRTVNEVKDWLGRTQGVAQ